MNKKIIIVGAGFSGTMTAVNLLNTRSGADIDVVLVDKRGTFGRGLAYTAPSDRFKLNVKAAAMGAWSAKPRHFIEWLSTRGFDASDDTFVPRSWYGQYLEALLEDTSQACAPSTLTRLHNEATQLSYSKEADRFTLTLDSGEQITSDALVLALGNLPRESCEGIPSQGVFADPYTPASYAGISDKKRLFVLGSGLTTVDCILEAESRGFSGSYHVLSRHGRLPLALEHSSHEAPPVSNLLELHSMRQLVSSIRNLSERYGSSQLVIDALRPHLQAVWKGLTDTERKRFLRHARSIWEVHRHRIPPEHARMLHALQASGRLVLSAGRIQTARAIDEAGRIEIEWTPRGADTNHRESFDLGLMCIGPESDLTRSPLPLARSLVASGLVTRGPLRLGARVATERLPEHVASRLLLVGPLEREDLWEITAVRELRDSAERAAKRLRAVFSG